MISEKEARQYKLYLKMLVDAHAEIQMVANGCRHFTADRSAHEALYHINRAIKDLQYSLEVSDEHSEKT